MKKPNQIDLKLAEAVWKELLHDLAQSVLDALNLTWPYRLLFSNDSVGQVTSENQCWCHWCSCARMELRLLKPSFAEANRRINEEVDNLVYL
jgi:hypothetical protein